MRFFIDMPLSPELTVFLSRKGHDAVHASQVGMDRAADETILQHAQREQRIVITADLDYPRLLAFTQASGPGLILFRGGDYGQQECVARLARALEAVPEEHLSTSIVVIEKGRIRRRALPLEPGP